MSNRTKPSPSGRMPEASSDAGVAEQRRHFEREALARRINTSRENADESAKALDPLTDNENRIGETT